MPITAHIDAVEVVGNPEEGNVLRKGLSVLTSRISKLEGQHAEYTVKVGHDGDFYSIQKRFSEFAAFHALLQSRFGKSLPFDLPAKTAVRHFSPDALDDRKNALNAYLKEVCTRTDFFECAAVLAFFKPVGDAAVAHPPRGGLIEGDDKGSSPPVIAGRGNDSPTPEGKGTGGGEAKGEGKGSGGGKGAPATLGAVQGAFGNQEKGYDLIFDAMKEAPEFQKEFGTFLEALPPTKQKLLSINTLLPVARWKVQATPDANSAKRKGILEGYRGKAAGKGIPWKETVEALRSRGMDVWEKEREECTDPSLKEPHYWEMGGKGTLHSYDQGNCCWDAAFDAVQGAYELVHAHHFPDVPAQECFFKLHRELDMATIDALDGGQAKVAMDVGCGTGTSTFSLRETLNIRGLEECKLIGVDLSTYFVAVARHRQKEGDKKDLKGDLQFVHGNALQVAEKDGEVDIFMASAITHELPSQVSEHLIAEAGRVLRPGGVFGYFDLNPVQLLRDNPVSNIVDRVAISNEPFLNEFLAFDLLGTLQATGFEVLQVRATNCTKWENWEDCPCRIVVAKKSA